MLQSGGKSCIHQVAWPPGVEGSSGPPPRVAPEKMAKEYPFTIDPFQQTAVDALENGDSVLVAAHTSAGKTVVAQYAMAMAIRDKSRVRHCTSNTPSTADTVPSITYLSGLALPQLHLPQLHLLSIAW